MSVVVCLALLPALVGCATKLPTETFVSPAVGARTYSRFMVYAAFTDLGAEGAFEKALCGSLDRAGQRCEMMLHAVPPDRKQNGANRHRAMDRSGAQAVLVIELADPNAASRRILADGRPGYRVNLVDIASQQIVARFAVDGRAGPEALAARARNVARAVVRSLADQGLLAR